MDELLGEFLTETSESLSMLDTELVKLEQNPHNPGLLDNIFRLVHTIKGTCGFLGLPRLETVAHASENVLGKMRDGELPPSAEAISLILESLDRTKHILAELEATEAEPEGKDDDLVARLNAMASGAVAAEAAMPVEAPAVEAAPVLVAEAEPTREVLPGEVGLDELDRLFQSAPGPEAIAAAPSILAAVATAVEAAKPADGADAPAESAVAAQSIRVSVNLLETLMTMVSELVLTRNQLLQMVRGRADSEFKGPLQRLSLVTTELQEGVMKTRMQPIGSAWSKLPRIVRDLGHELGKKIDLHMHGAETELDRQVLELIKDPLTHMVRNSADHGLETRAERLAAGKSEVGRISLNAFHEGGHIVIVVSDDGRGLDVDRIRAKALEKGLGGEAEISAMTDAQAMRFIFAPGFSTAAKVTAVSGRGVGMDVVRTNIERIGGAIDLRSEKGKGSAFTIKIPLTLAIVSALIVECQNERFAIPQLSVVELVRASKDSEHRIEILNKTPVLRLRNRLLPLVYLADCLKMPGAREGALTDGGEVFVVVSQVGEYSFGIVVDKVFDTEEIVVKPVAPLLRDISMLSGNTILGDGSVIMILDPNGIAASTSGAETAASGAAHKEAAQKATGAEEAVAMLVFRAGSEAPKAVPLSLVARLEEVDVKSVEQSNGRLMVQYRGKLMPLVPLDPGMSLRQEGRIPVLVFTDDSRSMGLVVDEIVDIIEEKLQVELNSERVGFIGSAVLAGKATEIVDVAHFLDGAFSDWFRRHEDAPFGDAASRRVLLVDDSSFFRNLLTPLLETAGYTVTTAPGPQVALKMREEGAEFDIIVSDIEMPDMNGFDFAREVKTEGRWKETPIVALTSHATPRDIERGRTVGFIDHVAKLDRDALLRSLSHTFSNLGEAA